MSTYDSATDKSSGIDSETDSSADSQQTIEERTCRALTEYMTVMEEAPDLYSVTSQSGREYLVDTQMGRCECPDAKHNLREYEQCKHERRTEFATGERAIPAEVPRDEVDPQLGEHVDGAVMFEGRVRVPVSGGVLVYRETADRLGKELVGFEDVESWSEIEEALAVRDLGRGAIYHKPVLDDSSDEQERREAVKSTPDH